MRRILTFAFLGLTIAGAGSVAGAQSRGRVPRAASGGQMDTARVRQMDSLRAVRALRGDSLRAIRGDSGRGRIGGPDSLRGRGGRGRGGPANAANVRAELAVLNLSNAQKASVKAINQRYAARMKELRESSGNAGAAPNPALRTKVQELGQQERAEVRATLTPEQQTKFDANAKARGGRGRGKPGKVNRMT